MKTNQGRQLIEAFAKMKKAISHTHGTFRTDVPQSEFFMLHTIRHGLIREVMMNGGEPPAGMRISTLSQVMKVAMPSVSQLVNSLEKKELVERVTTRHDRRVVYVRLTEAGNAILDSSTNSFLSLTEEIAERLGEENTQTLIRLCDQLYEILEDIKKRGVQSSQ